jgi:hypothetical protein
MEEGIVDFELRIVDLGLRLGNCGFWIEKNQQSTIKNQQCSFSVS